MRTSQYRVQQYIVLRYYTYIKMIHIFARMPFNCDGNDNYGELRQPSKIEQIRSSRYLYG